MHDNEKYKKIFKENKDSKVNMYDNINKMFKGMLDLNYIFSYNQDGMNQLPSSKDIFNKQKEEKTNNVISKSSKDLPPLTQLQITKDL